MKIKGILFLVFILVIGNLIFNSCEKEVSVSPPDEPPPVGKIILNSYPSGFAIYMDNKNRARQTPDSISWLDESEYKITLKKNLFRDSVFAVNLNKNEVVRLMIDYSSNSQMLGTLNINSIPEGASISLNDSITNQVSPYKFTDLLPGEYKIKLALSNHEAATYIEFVQSNKESYFIKGLVDTTIWETYDGSDFQKLSNFLTDIEIDKNNKIWIASRNGLILFDGEWKVLNQENSNLPHNVIRDIELDYENNLWIATQYGFAIARDNEIPIIYLKEGKTGNFQSTYYETDNVNSLYVKDRLPFYFGFDIGFGMAQQKYPDDQYKFYHFDSEIFRIYPYFFLNNFYVTSICRLVLSDRILIGTKGHGLIITKEEYIPKVTEDFRELDEIFEYFTKGSHALPSNSIIKIVHGDYGAAWILFAPDGTATRNALAYYDFGKFDIYHFSTTDPKINTIFRDSRNTIWLGTETGIIFFDDFNDKHYINLDNSGIDFGSVTGFSEDSFGNIWIITATSGLYKIKNIQLLFEKIE